MHTELCVCADVPDLDLRTRVELVAHKRELFKTTATGPLAVRALRGARLHVHGRPDEPVDLTDATGPDRRVLILYPGPDARVLDAALVAEDPRPVTLIVPDGTWRQARRMAQRIPGADRAEPVVLAPGPPTRWGVRREPKEDGLATIEAIARALGVIEGPEVQAALERLLELVSARTLWSRQKTGARYPG